MRLYFVLTETVMKFNHCKYIPNVGIYPAKYRVSVYVLWLTYFSSNSFWSNLFSSNPNLIRLDEMDWTENFGQKQVGRKLGARCPAYIG